MKKLFSILLVLCLFTSLALAETNLSQMSYDDLLTLQKDLVKEIMSRSEWKEVEVPAGQYTIGVDIPAGWYSVRPKSQSSYSSLYFRWYPNPSNNSWDYMRIEDKLGRFEFYEGMRIYLEDTAIFAPPISLDF